MKIILTYIVFVIVLLSCTSSKLTYQWKSPETISFEANKVLVIGISANSDSRRLFEQRLTTQLEKRGVVAVKSIDFFDQSFTQVEQSEANLDKIENQLLEAGFDAIIFSKVVGSESRVTEVYTFNNSDPNIESYLGYYAENQSIFFRESTQEIYQVYHSETALYCICPEKERELLWRVDIDIVDPQNTDRTIKSYVNVLIKELKSQQLLLVN